MSSKVRDRGLMGRERRTTRSLRKERSRRPGIEGLESRALLTTLIGLTNSDVLVQFQSATPGTIQKSTTITGMPAGQTIVSIANQNSTGNFLGLGSDSKIYNINYSTGAVTAISSTPISPTIVGGQFAITVNPVTNTIRLVDDSGQNIRISPTSGETVSNDSPLAYATGDTNAAASPNVVAIASTNMYNGSTTTSLYGIDSSTAALVQLGSTGGSPTSPNTGQLTTVGSLGFNIGESVGFDIQGSSNTGFAAMTETGSMPALYTINLSTGAATDVGTIGTGSSTLIGLAGFALTVPSAPNLSPASDSGSSNTDHITNINTPVITGTANPNATILIENLTTSVQLGLGKADASGNYSIQLGALADGTYNVVVIQGDGSGLYSTASAAMSPSLVIKTSAPAPEVPTLFPSSDTGFSNTDHYTRDNTPQFYGSGEVFDGNPDTVQLFANGTLIAQGPVQVAFEQYALQSSLLADGTYQITADEIDVAGNVSPMSAPMTPPLVVDTSSRPTPEEAFVNQVYLDLLGHPADQAGFTLWTPLVSQPNGRAAVVQGIEATTAYRDAVVTNAYETLLHRAPEASALTTGANYLLTHTDQQLQAILAGSTEYYKDHGSTNTSYVTALYPDLLGRPVDQAGLTKYVNALNGGALPINIAYIIIESQEGLTYTATNIYKSLLGRTPDSASLANMVKILNTGGTNENLITILASSPEYYQDANGSEVVINQWTQQAYQDLLGRAPSSTELASVKSLLISNFESPVQVIQALQTSTEYQGDLVKQAYQTVLNRAPEASAITAGEAYLQAGGTLQTLEAQLYGSQEFFQDAGSTNAGYLAALYQGVLGRPIDSGAAVAGLQQLNNGVSRTAIAQGLIMSLESSQRIVQQVYSTNYLRRVATYAEVTSLSPALSNGSLTYTFLVASLVGSQEYFSGL